jgi:hypothetical protein
MNVKKILVLLVLAGVAAAGAFASGNREQPTRPDLAPCWRGAELSEETVTVTGQVYFANRIHPELKSGSTEYELLVPRFYAYELDLKEGQTVTVEGYAVEGMPCYGFGDEEEAHLWVTKATIDGKEYDLASAGFRGGPMGPEWGYGMGPRMGGRRSPGWGMMDRNPRDWGRRW